MSAMIQRMGLLVALLTLFAVPLFSMNTALAASGFNTSRESACEGISLEDGVNGCKDGTTLPNILALVLQTLSIVVGIATVIMITIAGFKYVTSNGDASKVKSAKDTLIYAIVGIAVVLFAQSIVQFVLNRITK